MVAFLDKEQADQSISYWRQEAHDGDFDDDIHIVDPQAHFCRLEHLERDTVQSSEFFRCNGIYNFWDTLEIDSSPIWSLGNIPEQLSISIALLPDDRRQSIYGVEFQTRWRRNRGVLVHLWRTYSIVCNVAKTLENMSACNFCTSFFSILVKHPGIDVAEVVKIPIATVQGIKIGFETVFARLSDDLITPNLSTYLEDCLKVSFTPFLAQLGLSYPPDYAQMADDTIDSTLMLCRSIAILLDLAIVSYVGSHGSRFDQNYLQRNFNDIEVQNPTDEYSVGNFRCTLLPLACLNEFLDKKEVWVFDFHYGTGDRRSELRTPGLLYILTRMEDFADLWGPVWTVPAGENFSGRIKQYNVSKGFICRVDGSGRESVPGAIHCHWYSEAYFNGRRTSSLILQPENSVLFKDDLLLIGAGLRENEECRYRLADFEKDYSSSMGFLGTRPSVWQTDSRSLAFSLAKVFGVTVSGSQKLIPHTTVKQLILDKWTNNPTRANPEVLNLASGVEISHCTGNACRLPIKKILRMATVMPLLERQIPGWRTTDWGSRFNKALSSSDKKAISRVWTDFPNMRSKMADLVCCILEILDGTGRVDNSFVAGYLGNGLEKSVSLDLQKNDWTELLRDSHLMAVYALVNQRCLECEIADHSAGTCQTLSPSYTVLQTRLPPKSRGLTTTG